MTARLEDYGDRWLEIQVGYVERSLERDLGDRLPRERIAEAVAHATDRFHDAKVRPFLPMLIGRAARRELQGVLRHSDAA